MGRPLTAPPRPPADPDPDPPESLVRRLICYAPTTAASPAGDTAVVVLDIQVDAYRCVLIRQPEPGREVVELSPREREIARLVAKGLPNKVIARILDISTWTVGTYLRRIFAKLSVTTRAAMVAKLAVIQPHGRISVPGTPDDEFHRIHQR